MADKDVLIAEKILEKKEAPFIINFLSGWIGGVGKIMAAQPFDIMKVRLQTQDPLNPEYTGIKDCASKIWNNNGIMGFYKGSLMPLLGIGTICAIQFSTYQRSRKILPKIGIESNSPASYFISGGAAGTASSLVTTLVEHLRIRLQKQKKQKIYNGSVDAAFKIYHKYGLSAVFKGWIATIGRDLPFFAFWFLLYEETLLFLANGKENHQKTPLEVIISGSSCGVAAWLIIFPLDTFKSIAQAESLDAPVYKNYRDLVLKNFRSKGLGGLYTGLGPCMMRAVPVNAIVFLFYEIAKKEIFGYK